MGSRRGSLPNVDTAGTHFNPDELLFDRYALKVGPGSDQPDQQ
jgi:hypothetical protein